MAKYHLALVQLSVTASGVTPIQPLPVEAEQIIDTAVSEASTIYPRKKGLYWIITPLSADGWAKLGTKGTTVSAPLPVAALEQGVPLFAKVEKVVEAPLFRRLAIKAVA